MKVVDEPVEPDEDDPEPPEQAIGPLFDTAFSWLPTSSTSPLTGS
jgi:hypothetical protein